ncbi:MAG: site-specific DNA-methyltransferase, partial [Deltaproteobacteria bacterium]|nr:site-specific DNA-methyltransferase [Deltaproteobacteria bacterium]
METHSRIIFGNSNKMDSIDSESVDLIVTSPPYPMIKMWDKMFCDQNPLIEDALKRSHGMKAFELMHQELDLVWQEIFRVLKKGRFACINIGDAVRTIAGDFRLYPNHSRILHFLQGLGFSALPDILWRKQTNAPNKFMGSGMLPAGAYVTLEHEFILIARKGSKRDFNKEQEKRNRHESAIFWEERNAWFSDIWFDIKGASQVLGTRESRLKSGAFPFEIAYRLINMYSVKDDVVLDPFLGTGTTMAAAMASGRNSVGFEIDSALRDE